MKKKIINVLVVIVIILAIAGGVVAYILSNRIEYNDADATGNSAGNLYNGGLFCEYDGYVYFSNPEDYNQLYRMDQDGENLKKIHSDKPRYLNICNDYIYYVRFNHDSGQEVVFRGNMFGVYRLGVGDSTAEELYNDLADSLTLAGNTLYFQSYNDEDLIEVKSVDIDGKNLTKVSTDDFLPLSVYEGDIYYSNVDYNHNIVKMEVGNNLPITVKQGNYYMPIVEENILYYIDVEAGYKLMKENLETGESQVLTEDKCINYNVNTKYGVIYYQCENDEIDHRLMMMDLNGENEVLVEKGDFSNIHITKKYTYYYRIIAGGVRQLYYVETGKAPNPQQFR